jgi:hypothetical protein
MDQVLASAQRTRASSTVRFANMPWERRDPAARLDRPPHVERQPGTTAGGRLVERLLESLGAQVARLRLLSSVERPRRPRSGSELDR